ncbi:unnamed protein product, partial [Arabidopsis halleri]
MNDTSLFHADECSKKVAVGGAASPQSLIPQNETNIPASSDPIAVVAALVTELENVSVSVGEVGQSGPELAVNTISTPVSDPVNTIAENVTAMSQTEQGNTAGVVLSNEEMRETEQGWSVVLPSRKTSPSRKFTEKTELPSGSITGFRVLENTLEDGEIEETETVIAQLEEENSLEVSVKAVGSTKSVGKRNGKQKQQRRPILNKKDMLQVRPQVNSLKASSRKALWKELSEIQAGCVQANNPWIVVGDFNVTLSSTEHSRYLDYRQEQSAMRDFQNMVQNCGLEDLSYVGPVFTWSNSQDGVSDHARIWVQIRALAPTNRRPFQFFNHLATHPQFLEIVAQTWSSSEPLFHSRSALTLLHKKLKSMKEHLRRLNRERYGDLPSRVKAAYEVLCAKQNEALQNPQEETYEAVTEASERWNHLASIEEQFYQKSRVQWMQFVDQNTSYFHKTEESRAARNAIKRLKSSTGEILTELSDIKAEAVRH